MLHPEPWSARKAYAENGAETLAIRGMKFASIPVTDQDQTLAFYTEKLGFRLLTDQPYDDKQRWIELGLSMTDTRIVLFRSNDGIQPGTKMNVTFWADDVERTVRKLEEKGSGIRDVTAEGRLGYSCRF